MVSVSGPPPTPDKLANRLAHEAAGIMGKPRGEEIATLELRDGDVVEGRLYSMTSDRSLLTDGPSSVLLHVALNDVVSIRETYGSLQQENRTLRRERAALQAAMKRAVAVVPEVTAADLRRVYRETRGSYAE